MSWFQTQGQTRQGILLLIAAMAVLGGMDAIAKFLTEGLPPMQVVWARYTSQTMVVFIIFAPRLRQLMKTNHLRLQVTRSAFLFGATFCFFTGISQMGLGEAVALFEINPLLVSIGAFVFLKEPLGIRRLTAVTVGLIGALVIVRPGGDLFSPAAAFPLLAACSYAGYAVSTRFLGRDENILTSLIYTTLFGAVISSLLVVPVWVAPTGKAIGLMCAMGVVGTLGQWFLIRAFTVAEAGAIAPYSYVGLVFALIIGLVFWGEWPDAMTLFGASIIIGAGVYVWYRERRLSEAPIVND